MNTWGESWGTSWGESWGATVVGSPKYPGAGRMRLSGAWGDVTGAGPSGLLAIAGPAADIEGLFIAGTLRPIAGPGGTMEPN